MKMFGFRNALALSSLVEFYYNSNTFKKDVEQLARYLPNYRTASHGLTKADIKKIFLVNDDSDYFRITNQWVELWGKRKSQLSTIVIQKINEVTEKWGLRCFWGEGFVLTCAQAAKSGLWLGIILPTMLYKVPGKPVNLTLAIDGLETNKDLKERISGLAVEAERKRKQLRSYWDRIGYETSVQDNLAKAVSWLFMRVTPPYLSPGKIAEEENSDYVHVQREYQKIAKLLGIKLTKGWIKGRKRTYDRRVGN
ncbi:hypothetical protein [Dehalococcoides sp. UCH007]|uniref:hypothetical protein n=1 Tax=Dehalococcoides sp. UCH007 TaxID=1522671 RepID=UPI0005B570C5|nr:hypothetical protein [Dehalococcoides sp. UCH007]BAQ35235.1 hypothetical protein UCH007_12770 [Dehalococcoides sp. UCH007]